MLKVEGLTKSFGGIAAIRGVTLNFAMGSLSAIIGPNGAGKTTLFNLMSGATVPDAGRVLLDGSNIVGLSVTQIVRRGMTRAFQVARIFPSLTVAQSLLVAVQSHLGLSHVLGRRFPLKVASDRAFEVMEMLGLAREANTLFAHVSHADQKFLYIALALVFRPQVLLSDCPTAGVGTGAPWQIINKAHRLWQTESM